MLCYTFEFNYVFKLIEERARKWIETANDIGFLSLQSTKVTISNQMSSSRVGVRVATEGEESETNVKFKCLC